MANNRMYLVCPSCEDAINIRAKEPGFGRKQVKADDVANPWFCLSSWSPGVYYGTNSPETLGARLNDWLKYHDHGKYSEWPVTFEYENEPEE